MVVLVAVIVFGQQTKLLWIFVVLVETGPGLGTSEGNDDS